MNQPLGDGENLARFFKVIARFNDNKQMDVNFMLRIEDYFNYKWAVDRNQAIDDPDEYSLLMQLPSEVQDRLIGGFMFNKFLYKFHSFL